MGPNNPWSPNWRPDATGARLAAIRTARRGAALAGVLFIPVAFVAIQAVDVGPAMAGAVIVTGVGGVALLGAGLAPAAMGTRVDALAVGLAMAVGAPVAAVTSLVIAGFIGDLLAAMGRRGPTEFAAMALQLGVAAAVLVAPLVAIAAAGWVVGVRRVGDRGPNHRDDEARPSSR
jgi:hypothetical protein